MKKLERMDGKLFGSLQPNEMSKMSSLLGGYYTTQTTNAQGADTMHHYETWSATNGDSGANKDGLHDDSTKVTQNAQSYYRPDGSEIDFAAFTITEDHPDNV